MKDNNPLQQLRGIEKLLAVMAHPRDAKAGHLWEAPLLFFTVMVILALTSPVMAYTVSTSQAERGGAYTMPLGIHSTSVNLSLPPTPVSGDAPLEVSFFATALANADIAATFRVDFGDGQSSGLQPGWKRPPSLPGVPMMGRPDTLPNTFHTYSIPGTYTVQFLRVIPGTAQRSILNTITITVNKKPQNTPP